MGKIDNDEVMELENRYKKYIECCDINDELKYSLDDPLFEILDILIFIIKTYTPPDFSKKNIFDRFTNEFIELKIEDIQEFITNTIFLWYMYGVSESKQYRGNYGQGFTIKEYISNILKTIFLRLEDNEFTHGKRSKTEINLVIEDFENVRTKMQTSYIKNIEGGLYFNIEKNKSYHNLYITLLLPLIPKILEVIIYLYNQTFK